MSLKRIYSIKYFQGQQNIGALQGAIIITSGAEVDHQQIRLGVNDLGNLASPTVSSHQLRDLNLGRLNLFLGVDDRHRALNVGDVLLHPLEGILLRIGSVGGVGSRVFPRRPLLHPVPGVRVEEIFLVGGAIFSVVEQRSEGVSVDDYKSE